MRLFKKDDRTIYGSKYEAKRTVQIELVDFVEIDHKMHAIIKGRQPDGRTFTLELAKNDTASIQYTITMNNSIDAPEVHERRGFD